MNMWSGGDLMSMLVYFLMDCMYVVYLEECLLMGWLFIRGVGICCSIGS